MTNDVNSIRGGIYDEVVEHVVHKKGLIDTNQKM